MNSFRVAPVLPKPPLRKASGRQSRRKATTALYVRLRRTRGSCGHSGSSYALLHSGLISPSQRRRGRLVVSLDLRLRLHGEAATRRNTTSFTSALIAAGLARSGEVCLRHAWSRVWVFGGTGECGRLSGLPQFYMRVQPYKYRPTQSATHFLMGDT